MMHRNMCLSNFSTINVSTYRTTLLACRCLEANLNGKYQSDIVWKGLQSLKVTTMKIRPVNFVKGMLSNTPTVIILTLMIKINNAFGYNMPGLP